MVAEATEVTTAAPESTSSVDSVAGGAESGDRWGEFEDGSSALVLALLGREMCRSLSSMQRTPASVPLSRRRGRTRRIPWTV